jgi:hypothetical protein
VKQPTSSPGQEHDRTASRKLQSLKLTVRRTNQIAKEQKLVKERYRLTNHPRVGKGILAAAIGESTHLPELFF